MNVELIFALQDLEKLIETREAVSLDRVKQLIKLVRKSGSEDADLMLRLRADLEKSEHREQVQTDIAKQALDDRDRAVLELENFNKGEDDRLAEKVDALVDKRLEFIRRLILGELWDMLRENDALYDDLLKVLSDQVIIQIRDSTNEHETYNTIASLMGMLHGTLKNLWPIANKQIRQHFQDWLINELDAVEHAHATFSEPSDLPF